MTDFCYNRLRISGIADAVAQFKRRHMVQRDGKLGLTFEGALPMPEVLRAIHFGLNIIDDKEVSYWRGTDKDPIEVSDGELTKLQKRFGATSGWDWACKHWGTKWDARDTLVTERTRKNGELTLEITFATAWRFPLGWFKEAKRIQPELQFDGEFDEYAYKAYGRIVKGRIEMTKIIQDVRPVNEYDDEEEHDDEQMPLIIKPVQE